ncbi:hypothetical protein HPB51_017487 [Rhipicephalus microplus]|uniref:Uncharacterized protein n=1 Tax=Rhipicephalus microplus TaxID=6941 RepID=A0A9J6F612_RHIMP|nr:hypothetical protein HPB51_017487 [Rhipicephalus microplus]
MPAQSTPLPVRRHARMLTLSELDPRSPTTEIMRTPIQMEESVTPDYLTQEGVDIDPRSPTTAFQRTPIPLGVMIKRKVDAESPMAVCYEKRRVSENASHSPGTVKRKERKVKKSDEDLSGTLEQLTVSNTPPCERFALKSTSRPNTLLRSLQESNLQRAGKADYVAAPKRSNSSEEKENSIMPANA